MIRREPTPVVVLVHGAFHGGWCWDRLRAALAERNLASVALDLPGHGASPLAAGLLSDDVEYVRGVLRDIAAPIVLVGHSYGGAVIAEACAELIQVRHQVYLAALMPDVGETFAEVQRGVTGQEAPSSPIDAVCLEPEIARDLFYNGCSPRDLRWAIERLGAQRLQVFEAPCRRAGWRNRPSTYIQCSKDRALLPAIQRFYSRRAASVVTLPSGHAPFLSHPKLLARILSGLVGGL